MRGFVLCDPFVLETVCCVVCCDSEMAVSKKLFTRQSHRCPIFGLPKSLSGVSLPTYEDVLLCCFEEIYQLLVTSETRKNISFSIIVETVSCQIEGIYVKASIQLYLIHEFCK